jgi:class 3 adenylate cyclase
MGAGERPVRLLDVLERTQTSRALEERSATVLRVDLSGAPARLPPGPARRALHAFHVHVGEVVRAHGGLLEGVGEDRARAVFGLLEEGTQAAVSAVRAALELRETWNEVCVEWPPAERCPLRAGLSTGRVLVGEVGSESRPDVVLTGPASLLAAGLCQLAAGGQVLLSGTTLAAVGVRFEVEPLGEQAVGGERVAAFAVLEEDGSQSP